MYDFMGRLALNKTIDTNLVSSLDVAGLQQGAYHVTIWKGGQLIQSEKLILN